MRVIGRLVINQNRIQSLHTLQNAMNRTPRSGDLAGVSVRVNLDREYAKSDLTIDRSLARSFGGALTHRTAWRRQWNKRSIDGLTDGRGEGGGRRGSNRICSG